MCSTTEPADSPSPAAVWRTTKRALPAEIIVVSLTNAVSTGLPAASRCAATDRFLPAGTASDLFCRTALVTASPGLVSATSYVPAASSSGHATVAYRS